MQVTFGGKIQNNKCVQCICHNIRGINHMRLHASKSNWELHSTLKMEIYCNIRNVYVCM